MLHKFLFNASFHLFLISIDQELAKTVQDKGCPYCMGQLHQANYPRSPMGLPSPCRDYYDERISFCCDRCRKRITPQSVRFFGRRWFPAPLFILINVFMLGINELRILQIKRHFGVVVSESTWKRWRRWWRERFIKTEFWQQAKGLLVSPLSTEKSFTRALLNRFSGKVEEKFFQLLRFLAPLTGGDLRAV